METEAHFTQAMAAAGIPCSHAPVPDGRIHRFTPEGERGDNKDAWYVLHGDGIAAGAFGSWRTGLQETWCARALNSLSLEEQAAYQRRMEVVKAQRDREREQAAEEARNCSRVWLGDYDAADGNNVGSAAAAHVSADRCPDHVDGSPAARSASPHGGSALVGLFRYRDHRTTCLGRLVLEFEHEESGTIAVMFFNVDIKSKRGKSYPAGEHGQFTIREKHKFRRFFEENIGKPTSPHFRWSHAHTKLRKLKDFTFEGDAQQRLDAEDRPYWKLRNVRKSGDC